MIGYTPTPSVLVEVTGRIQYCNKGFSDLTGFTYGEVIGAGLLSALVPPEWLEPVAGVFSASGTGQATGKHHLELLRKDGSRAPVEMSYSVLGGDNDRSELFLLIFSDLTGQMLSEAAADKRESGLARALRIAQIGTWEIDLATGAFTCSDEVYRIVGMAPEKGGLGRLTDLQSFIALEDLDLILTAFESAMKGTGISSVTLRAIRLDGELRIVRVEGEGILGITGEVTHLFGTVQDITERKRAEDELKAAKAQAELYVDLMGHDINNMNQIAMGYLELAENILATRGSLSYEDRFLLSRPFETLRDNSRLIDNVRKVQKSKAGVYRSEEVEIQDVLRDVTGRFSDISGRDVQIQIVSSCSCRVIANELLQEVFQNLVGNAIKHSTGPLEVRIAAVKCVDEGSTMCRISVEDNGPGIPDDLKKKLFDRLSLEKTRASGKGFGLCLTKMLVDDFSGRFWVEDRVKGDHTQGCRFVVVLPTAEKGGK